MTSWAFNVCHDRTIATYWIDVLNTRISRKDSMMEYVFGGKVSSVVSHHPTWSIQNGTDHSPVSELFHFWVRERKTIQILHDSAFCGFSFSTEMAPTAANKIAIMVDRTWMRGKISISFCWTKVGNVLSKRANGRSWDEAFSGTAIELWCHARAIQRFSIHRSHSDSHTSCRL